MDWKAPERTDPMLDELANAPAITLTVVPAKRGQREIDGFVKADSEGPSDASGSGGAVNPLAPPPRLGFIDTLRGAAAVYVILFHVWRAPNPPVTPPRMLQSFIGAGWSGVTLFFILSAFTLAMSLDLRRDEPRPLLSFYIRRFYRIAPLFYVWLALMAVRTRSPIRVVLLNASFGYNFFPVLQEGIVWASWTISIEMIFYLILPVILQFASTWIRIVAALLATLGLARLLEGYVGTSEAGKSYNDYAFFHHLPVFIVGIICYLIYRDSAAWRSRYAGAILVAFSAAGHLALTLAGIGSGSMGLYLYAANYGLLTLGMAFCPTLGELSVTKSLGKMSYSLYLNHPILISLLSPLFASYSRFEPGVHYSLSILLLAVDLLALSAFTYRFIERPGIRLGDRIILGARQASAVLGVT
jgi:peptidoglycan/LPS O-acetylase OafA/YrhL